MTDQDAGRSADPRDSSRGGVPEPQSDLERRIRLLDGRKDVTGYQPGQLAWEALAWLSAGIALAALALSFMP